jgi:hypothetical protein
MAHAILARWPRTLRDRPTPLRQRGITLTQDRGRRAGALFETSDPMGFGIRLLDGGMLNFDAAEWTGVESSDRATADLRQYRLAW